jgi:L-fucose isomerase-like protein
MTEQLQPTNQPVGVLMFGRIRPGFDQEWSAEIRKRCRAALDTIGVQCFGADGIVYDDQTVYSALDAVHEAHCRALIIIQPSLADGQYALAISQRWRGPVILWATPERPGDGKVSSCSLVGQHLWASILRQAGHPFIFVYGAPEEVHESLGDALAISSTIDRLRTAKVGVIGSHAPGFIDLAPDPFLIRKTFGLQMHQLSLPQFIDRVRAVPENQVRADLETIGKLSLRLTEGGQTPTGEALEMNARFYVALRDLMKEFSLDALSIQCWPELPNILGQWPYFAVSRLSAENEAISIEGDVDGAIGALISKSLGIGPGFLTDWLEHDEDTIFFWHPGMAPLDMCNAIGCDDGPSIGDHFNNARPFVVDGPIRVESPVTVTRWWRCDGRYHFTAFEGNAIPPRRRVSGNSLLVEFSGGGVPARFERLIHAGMPHHVSVYFGSQIAKFRKLAAILGAEWHD